MSEYLIILFLYWDPSASYYVLVSILFSWRSSVLWSRCRRVPACQRLAFQDSFSTGPKIRVPISWWFSVHMLSDKTSVCQEMKLCSVTLRFIFSFGSVVAITDGTCMAETTMAIELFVAFFVITVHNVGTLFLFTPAVCLSYGYSLTDRPVQPKNTSFRKTSSCHANLDSD